MYGKEEQTNKTWYHTYFAFRDFLRQYSFRAFVLVRDKIDFW